MMQAILIIELLSKNKNQAFLGLTKAKFVEQIFDLCTFTMDIRGKFKGPTAIITRSIARILA